MTLFSEFLKRRSKPKISFPSFFAFRRGVRGEPEKIERKIFGLATRESASASEARSIAIGAHASIPSHHALGACEVSHSAAGNGFAQRLVCQHRKKLRVRTEPRRFAARQGRAEKKPVAKRRIQTGRRRRSGRFCPCFVSP
ncbi:MAG: hypothetical protein Q7R73_05030 [bacterium]|nr:hypothetical protein [bacterium]